MPETICINGRFLSQAVTGVQRYALEILRGMDALLGKGDYANIRMLCMAPPGGCTLPAWKNIEIQKVGTRRDNLWEQVDLPQALKGRLLFSPGNSGPWIYRRQVITFHDASTFSAPEAYSTAFRAKYALTINLLARTARLVLTDSLFSQRELARHLALAPGRFRVIALGGDHLNEIRADEGTLARHQLSPNGYFLSVASQSRHKNFGIILRAAELCGPGSQFAAVGGSFGRIFQDAGLAGLPANVHSLGYLGDPELKALYENALGFIFPSMYEGFGLPVLEAMNCGCPVLCSRAASLPEVAGEAVYYFDPLNVEELAAGIRKVQENPAMADSLRQAGRKQAEGFTWEKTARETIAAIVASL